jgi:long-subunit acyl-CoA synthetase (AMP-forming)
MLIYSGGSFGSILGMNVSSLPLIGSLSTGPITSGDVASLIREGLLNSLIQFPSSPMCRVVSTRASTHDSLADRKAKTKVEDVPYSREVPSVFQWAHHLHDKLDLSGLPPGESRRVIVLGKQCPSTVRAVYAVFLAGAVPVLLFPEKSSSQLREESERSGARLALVENDGFAQSMACTTLTFEQFERELPAGTPTGPLSVQKDPLDEALVLFTSGTSGQGKMVVKNQLSLAQNVVDFRSSGQFRRFERVSSVLYIAHIYPLLAQLACADIGMTAVLPGWRKNSNRVNPLSNTMAVLCGDCHHVVLIPMYYPRLKRTIIDRVAEIVQEDPVKGGVIRLAFEAGMAEQKVYYRSAYRRYGIEFPSELNDLEEDTASVIQAIEDVVNQFGVLKKLPFKLIWKALCGNALGVVLLARATSVVRDRVSKEAYGPSIRDFNTGGSQIDWDSHLFVEGCLGRPLNNGWGSTEAGILTFSHVRPHWIAQLLRLPIRVPRTVGYFQGAEAKYFKDPDTNVLYVAGPTLFNCYEGDPDKTAQATLVRDGTRYYNTEDIVAIYGRGPRQLIQILDRAGREYKTANSGGEFVMPSLFETELCKHPLANYAVVWGNPNYNDSVAVVSLDQAALLQFANEKGIDLTTDRSAALEQARLEILGYGRNTVQAAVGKLTRVVLKDVLPVAFEDSFEQNEDYLTNTKKPRYRNVVEAFRTRLMSMLSSQ